MANNAAEAIEPKTKKKKSGFHPIKKVTKYFKNFYKYRFLFMENIFAHILNGYRYLSKKKEQKN